MTQHSLKKNDTVMESDLKVSQMIQEIIELTGLDKRVIGKYLGVSQHSIHAWSFSTKARISKPQVENIEKLYKIVKKCVDELIAENSFLQDSGETVNRKWVRSRLKDSDDLLQFRRELIQPSIHGDLPLDQKLDGIWG